MDDVNIGSNSGPRLLPRLLLNLWYFSYHSLVFFVDPGIIPRGKDEELRDEKGEILR